MKLRQLKKRRERLLKRRQKRTRQRARSPRRRKRRREEMDLKKRICSISHLSPLRSRRLTIRKTCSVSLPSSPLVDNSTSKPPPSEWATATLLDPPSELRTPTLPDIFANSG